MNKIIIHFCETYGINFMNKISEENDIKDMDDLKDQQAEMNDFFKDYADENQEGVEDDLKALEEEMEKEASQNLPMANKEKISTKEKIKNEENELEKFMMG